MPRFEVIQGGKDEDKPTLRDVSKGKKQPRIVGGRGLYESKLYTEEEIKARNAKNKKQNKERESEDAEDNDPDPITA